MTLIVETPRCSYVADGVQREFATTWTFEKLEEVSVWFGQPTVTDCCDAPSYDNLKFNHVDWEMLPGNWLVDGGVVQFRGNAIPPAGQLVTLMRTTPPDQPEGFGDLEEFTPEQHEKTLDRVTRMIQELYHNPFGVVQLGDLGHDWAFYLPDVWTSAGGAPPLALYNYDRPVAYPADLAGSVFDVLDRPTAAVTVPIVDKASAALGSLTIPTSGPLTVALAAVTLAVGNQMRFLPPADWKGAGGFSGTLAGTLV